VLKPLLCSSGLGPILILTYHACDTRLVPRRLRACFPARRQPARPEWEALKQKPMGVQATGPRGPAGGGHAPPPRLLSGPRASRSPGSRRLDLPSISPKAAMASPCSAKDLPPSGRPHFRPFTSQTALRSADSRSAAGHRPQRRPRCMTTAIARLSYSTCRSPEGNWLEML